MRFLQFSDVHLDRPFAGLGRERAEAFRRRLLEAFRRALALAVEERVDMVLIPGDLADGPHLRPSVEADVLAALGDLGVPVLVAAGNHDPVGTGLWARPRPGNVHVFSPTGEIREVGGVRIWGRSFASAAEEEPAFAGVPAADVYVLHADRLPTGQRSPYRPFADEDVPRAAWVAVGHHHRPADIPSGAYAGSLVPLDPSEAATPGGVLLGELGVGVTRRTVGVATFARATIDVEAVGDVAQAIRAAAAEAGAPEVAVEVVLTGMVSPQASPRWLEADLPPGVVVRDRTASPPDASSPVVRAFLAALPPRSDRVGDLARRYGLRALADLDVLG